MVTRINNDLQERLRKAEEAEHAVTKLGSLGRRGSGPAPGTGPRPSGSRAGTAPAGTPWKNASARWRMFTKSRARSPRCWKKSPTMVSSLYHLFKEIDAGRREALEQMAIVDRVDYEAELTDMEAEQEAMGRDPSSVEYLIAARHGYARVKMMMEETFPNFSYLKDCDLEDPMRRDVAQFILSHVVPIEEISVVHNSTV